MNFKLHESDIKSLLSIPGQRQKEGQKGLYIISRDNPSDSYKIGVSYGRVGLWGRLKNYKICFPFLEEFHVNYIITCWDDTDAKQLEKIMLSRTELQRIERNPANQGRVSDEYRFVSSNANLKKAIMKTLNDHPMKWKSVVVFGSNGWRVYNNQRTADGRRFIQIKALVKPSARTNTMPSIF